MPPPPSRRGKINCVHCGALFHPYEQGDIRLCKVCIRSVRLHFWKGTVFHGMPHPNIDPLSEKETAVLRKCAKLSTGRSLNLEKLWENIDRSLKESFSDRDLKRNIEREGRAFLKTHNKSLRTVMKKDLARAMGWSRPTLDANIKPMFEYKVLLRTSRTGIVPNIPLVIERITGKPYEKADEFYTAIKKLK
ncbi:MAG: hypothetical protein FJ149_02315 [Euryarchaeota archaeon]|nr:hypothetical protein [Euryarchaeota archaeon]